MPDTTRLSWRTDRRSNALFQLLSALALIPLLLSNGRTVVSTEATLLAAAGGLLAGAAASLVLDRLDHRRDDIQTVIASVAAIIVGTAVIFLLVPRSHTPTFMQFTVAFVWGSSLTSAVRHLVWPAITDSR